jgi:hypothetical protein
MILDFSSAKLSSYLFAGAEEGRAWRGSAGRKYKQKRK